MCFVEYSRESIATLILKRLTEEKGKLMEQFTNSKTLIGHFVLDNLLPEELVKKIHDKFPSTTEVFQRKNLREFKHMAYQMNAYDPILEETIYAFQDNRVVKIIEEICDLNSILPDESLYAGGLSMMGNNNFLNPHLDNSHDGEIKRWRVLNLLFYVTPEWEKSYGGSLELWSKGLKTAPIEITSKFNRLVVMATHQNSWHSVNKITTNRVRCCVSNYYFSENPISNYDKFHVTSFRGRPNQGFVDIILRFDSQIRKGVRKLFKKGLRANPHKYKR